MKTQLLGTRRLLQLFDPIPYRKLSSGSYGTCALGVDGSVRCFGPFDAAQDWFVALETIAASGVDLIDIAYGLGPGCGLTASSTLLCSKHPSTLASPPGVPVAPEVREIGGLARPREIIFSHSQNACTLGDCVQCWGLNGNGQLGDGTTEESADPVVVDWGAP